MFFNRETVKLGRRTLTGAASFLIPPMRAHQLKALPPAPPSVDWTKGVKKWGMFRNNVLGTCTLAARGNALIQWSTLSQGGAWIVSDDSIMADYQRIGGYNGTPSTDNGCYPETVLSSWACDGWNTGRQVPDVAAWGSVNQLDRELVCNVIDMFGGLYAAIDLPLIAENQTVWSTVTGAASSAVKPGSWGGHMVWIPAYDDETLTCITWAAPLQMTWDFFLGYCDQAFAIFSRNDWLNTRGLAPNHFSFDSLMAALPPIPQT